MLKKDDPTILDKMHSQTIGWLYFVPLIFSAFYFVPLIQLTFSWVAYGLVFFGYAVFLALYILCRVNPEKALIYIAGTCVVVMSLSTVNYASYSLIWYGAYFAGYLYSPKKASVIVFHLIICLLIAAYISNTPMKYFLIYGTVPCIGLALFGGVDHRVKKQEAEKREKNKQIESLARIAERERLSRDMHDVLGHSLTAISLKAQVACKLGNGGNMEKALQEMEDIQQLASSALTDVRQAISQYKRKSFAEHVSALSDQLRAGGFSTGVEVGAEEGDAKKESALVLIVTEAVTNILRHSKGNEALLSFQTVDGKKQLSVSDNGKVKNYTAGNGVTGIQSRADEIDAKVDILHDNGFRVVVSYA